MAASFADIHKGSAGDLREGTIAILGVPFGVDYPGRSRHAASAPAAIRAASRRIGRHAGNLDFTFGAPLTWDLAPNAIDLGDVPEVDQKSQHAATALRVAAIRGQGGIPLALGGDHSVPIGILRGFEDADPFWIVQFDAHLDIRDDVDGEREGLSNGMRRALEMPWVKGIIQIGIRGIGSARAGDLADVAEAKPCIQVTARDIRREGFAAVRDAIPVAATRFYVTLDLDAFDPAIAPGVVAPSFGGLDYLTVLETLEVLADRGSIIGMDIVELAPPHDVNDLTALLAARVAVDAMVLMSRRNDKAA
jgi:agmatinase